MSDPNVNECRNLPNTVLTWQLIRSYLKRQGYSLEVLRDLPSDQQKELMTAANMYASLKMAEIEAFSKLRNKIHIRI